MTLQHRLHRLESRSTRTKPVARCDRCGVPRGHQPIYDVVNGNEVSVLDRCSACGFPLNDDGRPLFALPPGRGQKLFGTRVDWRAV